MAERPAAARKERATRVAAAAFFVAMVASITLLSVYVVGGNTLVEGVLLGVAFGGVAVGLVVWAKVLLDEPDLVEERPQLVSTDTDRRAFEATYLGALALREPGDAGRRRFLARLLTGVAATLGIALLLPFRSLGPVPERSLFRTGWRRGIRLVGFDGRPLRPDNLRAGAVETVFPQAAVGSYDSQALLIAVDPEKVDLPEGSPPTVEGLLCFSKVCTHAGCPVGLYRSAVGELLCPCHQSRFDVFRGAIPISGPTVRPLPQLPLGVDDEGFLVALDDFEEPIGPGFWNQQIGER